MGGKNTETYDLVTTHNVLVLGRDGREKVPFAQARARVCVMCVMCVSGRGVGTVERSTTETGTPSPRTSSQHEKIREHGVQGIWIVTLQFERGRDKAYKMWPSHIML